MFCQPESGDPMMSASSGRSARCILAVMASFPSLFLSLPLPHEDAEWSSVRCLHSFAWDLERTEKRMDYSVFETFPFVDGAVFGEGGRSLPPRGRAHTFAAAFRHFERAGVKIVVELGTTRSFLGEAARGNEGINAGCFDGGCTPDEVQRWWHPDDPSFWDWGAGFFGRLAALCLGHLGDVEQHQVDYAEAHILRAQAINKDMPHVRFYHSTSEDFLENFDGTAGASRLCCRLPTRAYHWLPPDSCRSCRQQGK